MDAGMVKKSITVQELTDLFRAHGVAASQIHLAEGIERGVFPFAFLLSDMNGKRNFLISRKGAEEWLTEFFG